MSKSITSSIVIAGVVLILLLSNRVEAGTSTNTTATMQGIYTNALSSAFGFLTTTQIDSIIQIISAFSIYGDGDVNKLNYILATAWHESRLKPIEEIRAQQGTSVYNLQQAYWNSGYYGRGFVQLTFEENYRKMSNIIGVDLVSNPELALLPTYAAQIIVYGMMNGTFTGRRLSQYINQSGVDYVNARRVVNGTDRADLIAGHALDIENYLS